MNQRDRRLRTERDSRKANRDCSRDESHTTLLSKAVSRNLFRRARTLTGAGPIPSFSSMRMLCFDNC